MKEMTKKTSHRNMQLGRFVGSSLITTAACAALPALITVLVLSTQAEKTWEDYKDALELSIAGSAHIELPLALVLTLLLWPLAAYVINRFRPLTFRSIFAAGAIAWIPWGACVVSMMVWNKGAALNSAVVAAAWGYTLLPFVSLCLFYYFYLRHVYAQPVGANTAAKNFQHSIQ